MSRSSSPTNSPQVVRDQGLARVSEAAESAAEIYIHGNIAFDVASIPLRINSYDGSVPEGQPIYSALRHHAASNIPVPIECHVQTPAMSTEALASGVNLDRHVAASQAEIERREGYEGELRAALAICTAPPQPLWAAIPCRRFWTARLFLIGAQLCDISASRQAAQSSTTRKQQLRVRSRRHLRLPREGPRRCGPSGGSPGTPVRTGRTL
ncbi:hypothetical protein [Variovorax paradoxus]|uniref:hypothetical protein n=1 Tax=Variovorax paradoxus TaxID=34073 RepID=UPI003D6612D3